jgi:hypothetical protein
MKIELGLFTVFGEIHNGLFYFFHFNTP